MSRVFCFALALSFFRSCSEGTTRDVAATVLSVEGEVFHTAIGGEGVSSVNVETALRPGEEVRTSSTGQLDLILIPGFYVHVAPDSELKIDKLTLTEDGNETEYPMRNREVGLRLDRGTIVARFDGFGDIVITSPHATIAVLPSALFRLEVADEKTRLECVRGSVEVTPIGGPMVSVEAGQVQQWPGAGAAHPISNDAEAKRAAAEALEMEQRLLELQARVRNQLPR